MIFKRGNGEEGSAPVFIVDCISESRSWSRPGMQGVEFSAPLYVYDNTQNTNIATTRQQKTDGFNHIFTSDEMIESSFVSNKTAEITSSFPLYVARSSDGRKANFDEAKLEELFSDVEQPDENSRNVWPEDIVDYIYASLHSSSYREKYKDFLKADFPKIPRPESWSEFWRLVELGRELRQLHLMQSPGLDAYATTYPVAGDNIVEKPHFVPDTSHDNNATSSADTTSSVPSDTTSSAHATSSVSGRVYINATQYFGNVPQIAWEFYIGGYQPAQKWLKDRKARPLANTDLDHYQRIIKILFETDRIMKEIG